MLDQTILSEYNEVRQTPNTAIFCHAPFVSMNFAQNGQVRVCCYNKTHVLGTYPQHTLYDMWYGEAATYLRDQLRQNMLPVGCDLCHEQFQSKNFGGLRARAYDTLAETAYPESHDRFLAMPKVMEFEISNLCNLECTMCNGFFSSLIRRHRENLPPLRSPYDAAFVEQLESFIPHLSTAKFLGGEPFLIKPYYRIWERIVDLNPDMDVSITTNGTVLTERAKQILEQLNACIVLSIDSLEPETYEHIRINASFERVMAHAQYFQDYVKRKQTSLVFAVCPMQQNWRELPYFLEYCNTRDIYLAFNTVTWPGHVALPAMGHDDLRGVVACLESVTLPDDTAVQHYNRVNYLGLIQQITSYRNAAFYRERRHFHKEDIRSSTWWLNVQTDNAASLVAPSKHSEDVRVLIEKAETSTPWHIQLNKGTLSVKANHRYLVTFEARADGPRRLAFAIARAYAPWDSLGLYQEIALTPEWQCFQARFTPTESDDQARLYFDLGGNATPVDVSNVAIYSSPLK